MLTEAQKNKAEKRLSEYLIEHYGNSIKEEVYTAYKKMWNAAKKEDLTLIVTSSYRSYETQDNLWNSRANKYGDDEADKETARAGFSEHQTGLAIDICVYRDNKCYIEHELEKQMNLNGYKKMLINMDLF